MEVAATKMWSLDFERALRKAGNFMEFPHEEGTMRMMGVFFIRMGDGIVWMFPESQGYP